MPIVGHDCWNGKDFDWFYKNYTRTAILHMASTTMGPTKSMLWFCSTTKFKTTLVSIASRVLNSMYQATQSSGEARAEPGNSRAFSFLGPFSTFFNKQLGQPNVQRDKGSVELKFTAPNLQSLVAFDLQQPYRSGIEVWAWLIQRPSRNTRCVCFWMPVLIRKLFAWFNQNCL